MSLFAKKVLAVGAAVAAIGALIGLYVADWATSFPKQVSAAPGPPSSGGVNLTLETVAAVGSKYSSHPSWVSYLVRTGGKWVHSTDFTLPANSVVHVTIYQFDTPTGLRNPFLSQVQGTEGGVANIDGKPTNTVEPEEASHTFAIPELGVFVPLPGVPEGGKHPCEEAPCEPSSMDHRSISFSFRTHGKGRFRWQCFVPCGAGWYFGNGGPMQTLGYMDGFIDVV